MTDDEIRNRVQIGAAVACLLLFLASIDSAFGQTARPPSTAVVTGGAPNGRFQIVNGTPDVARNIMLLDTVTGDTWLFCNVAGSWEYDLVQNP